MAISTNHETPHKSKEGGQKTTKEKRGVEACLSETLKNDLDGSPLKDRNNNRTKSGFEDPDLHRAKPPDRNSPA